MTTAEKKREHRRKRLRGKRPEGPASDVHTAAEWKRDTKKRVCPKLELC